MQISLAISPGSIAINNVVGGDTGGIDFEFLNGDKFEFFNGDQFEFLEQV